MAVEGKSIAEEMKPWEQHGGVISMPRFDYAAPSSLLHRSHSGFLITCPIKREKSATKEAMSILEKYIGPFNTDSLDSLESHVERMGNNSKRQKLCVDEPNEKGRDGSEGKSMDNSSENAGALPNNNCIAPGESDKNAKPSLSISLVKLRRSGLLLFTFPGGSSLDTVDIVSSIFESLATGSMKSPLWCHRIFPIQATCSLDEKDLHDVVSKLVFHFVNNQNKFSTPAKFAVGYNRRGIEETEMKDLKNASTDLCALLDRSKCFSVVAGAVKKILSNSVVDLKSPDFCVLVELLPLSGVPSGSLVVAVSVLPHDLVSTKPRLCIKALVSGTKERS